MLHVEITNHYTTENITYAIKGLSPSFMRALVKEVRRVQAYEGNSSNTCCCNNRHWKVKLSLWLI